MKFIIKLISILLISFSALDAHVIAVNSLGQLQNIISKNAMVVVKFYANFCGPCRSFAPIYDSVSNAPELNSVVLVEVNIERNQEIAKSFGIQHIPKMYFFKNGNLQSKQGKTNTSSELKSLIKGQFSL